MPNSTVENSGRSPAVLLTFLLLRARVRETDKISTGSALLDSMSEIISTYNRAHCGCDGTQAALEVGPNDLCSYSNISTIWIVKTNETSSPPGSIDMYLPDVGVSSILMVGDDGDLEEECLHLLPIKRPPTHIHTHKSHRKQKPACSKLREEGSQSPALNAHEQSCSP